MNHNSTIIRNPEYEKLVDLSYLGVIKKEKREIKIYQQNHLFQICDVIYYNQEKEIFDRAIAENTQQSEVCGVVSNIIDNDNFVFISNGEIVSDRYGYETGTIMYLSQHQEGGMTNKRPKTITKEIAKQISKNKIKVEIKRGFKEYQEEIIQEEFSSYTKDELNEICSKIWR